MQLICRKLYAVFQAKAYLLCLLTVWSLAGVLTLGVEFYVLFLLTLTDDSGSNGLVTKVRSCHYLCFGGGRQCA